MRRSPSETGLEPELVERILVILGTPLGSERLLSPEDVKAMRHCARVLAAGFPLVAFLQLVRVYVQSLRRIADAEVRLFHLYVHEPLIRDAVPELEMAEEMGELAGDILPLAAPLTEYLHTRYLRFFLEQDVVGHMESDLGMAASQVHHVPVTLCFIDLTGFTRYTEEEGDLEALDVVENFVETVEATLPPEATIVKTIGDEVMVVSPDPASLTEWAVRLMDRFPQRPQPRVGIHYAQAVYRDGDYFGTHVNLAHRVVNRAQAGEVLVTDRVSRSPAGPQPGLRADRRGQPQGIPGPDPALRGPRCRLTFRCALSGYIPDKAHRNGDARDTYGHGERGDARRRCAEGGLLADRSARGGDALRRSRLGLPARPCGVSARLRRGHRTPRQLRTAG